MKQGFEVFDGDGAEDLERRMNAWYEARPEIKIRRTQLAVAWNPDQQIMVYCALVNWETK